MGLHNYHLVVPAAKFHQGLMRANLADSPIFQNDISIGDGA